LLDQTPAGPVLAVGHSYGGAVITNAATNANNVVGLVYVAAFAPDEGESLADIESNSKDSMLLPALVELRYPTGQGSETAVEFAINRKPSRCERSHLRRRLRYGEQRFVRKRRR
jgi:pimeloyl-ACP methyl ester carboxylesterase